MSTIYWIRLIRFRSYLLVLRNKRAADIGFKKDFHRMVACLRLGVATSPPAFCLEWVNWRDIFVHAAITETIVKINLERIKEHFESLMDREQREGRRGSELLIQGTPLRCLNPLSPIFVASRRIRTLSATRLHLVVLLSTSLTTLSEESAPMFA